MVGGSVGRKCHEESGISMTIGYFDSGGFYVPSGFALNGVPCAS
jgi:hypothetical protein